MSSEKDDMEATAAPLIEHLTELRTRLMYAIGAFVVAFIICYSFSQQIFNLLVIPYSWAVELLEMDPQKVQFIYTAPQEFFFTKIKIGAFGGLVLAFPLIAFQLYRFVAPGLYTNERKAFVPYLVATPVLFLLGAALVYFMIIPMAMWFFLSMEQPASDGVVAITNLPKVSEYLSLIMTLIFAFGLVFQLPVGLTLMARAGIITAESLAEKRKYAIVIAFVAAAILTPPDPLTQIGLAVPTLMLYELSIFMARRVQPPKSEWDDEDDEEEGESSEDASGDSEDETKTSDEKKTDSDGHEYGP